MPATASGPADTHQVAQQQAAHVLHSAAASQQRRQARLGVQGRRVAAQQRGQQPHCHVHRGHAHLLRRSAGLQGWWAQGAGRHLARCVRCSQAWTACGRAHEQAPVSSKRTGSARPTNASPNQLVAAECRAAPVPTLLATRNSKSGCRKQQATAQAAAPLASSPCSSGSVLSGSCL